MSKGGGFILAPAKPLQPETPTLNAMAVVESFADNTCAEQMQATLCSAPDLRRWPID